MGNTRSKASLVGTNSFAWPLPSYRIERAFAISKPRSAQHHLYHMGFRAKISRNTLAHANEVRDWRIYAGFAQILIGRARHLYANDSFGVELDQTAYALDSTLIDLGKVFIQGEDREVISNSNGGNENIG